MAKKKSLEEKFNEWLSLVPKALTTRSYLWTLHAILSISLVGGYLWLDNLPKEVCCCTCEKLEYCIDELGGEDQLFIIKPVLWFKDCERLCSEQELNYTEKIDYQEFMESKNRLIDIYDELDGFN